METTTKNARHILSAVRIAPIISAFCMLLLVCLLLVYGHQTPTTEALRGFFAFSTAGTAVILFSSYYLHLCTVHRLFIYYTEFVSDACAIQAAVGFGWMLIYFRLFALMAGLMLFIYFFTHLKQYFTNGKRRNQ